MHPSTAIDRETATALSAPVTAQCKPAILPRLLDRGGARPEHGTAPEATNAQVADKLRQAGDILAMQGAAPFRVAAYRRAVDSILALTRDLGIIVARGGRKALEAIPGVGVSIAGAWHLSSPFSRSTP
jgi:hypothetical protein